MVLSICGSFETHPGPRRFHYRKFRLLAHSRWKFSHPHLKLPWPLRERSEAQLRHQKLLHGMARCFQRRLRTPDCSVHRRTRFRLLPPEVLRKRPTAGVATRRVSLGATPRWRHKRTFVSWKRGMQLIRSNGRRFLPRTGSGHRAMNLPTRCCRRLGRLTVGFNRAPRTKVRWQRGAPSATCSNGTRESLGTFSSMFRAAV
mmetsp:Transcript_1193/g.3901  ORF Transcript_1193/g.3901 Transcript_1193/m.3901 type:complete len:201 (+) Transcript_1193:2826-3428(+)